MKCGIATIRSHDFSLLSRETSYWTFHLVNRVLLSSSARVARSVRNIVLSIKEQQLCSLAVCFFEILLPNTAMAERLVERDLLTVLEQMWEAREKWYNIGLCFNIPPSKLDIIKKESVDDVDEMFTKMIKEWLRKGQCCNWTTAYNALKSPTVGKDSTAEKLREWYREGRKRKAGSQDGGQSKKLLLDESDISRGPACPTVMSGPTATHGECVYFTAGNYVFEFDVASRNWTKCIECPHKFFGLAAIGNELVAVGGLIEVPTNKVLNFSLEKSSTRQEYAEKNKEQNMWEEKYPPMNNERVFPSVLVYEKYLIVIGGYMHVQVENKILRKAVVSMEVLDIEEKHWYVNDNINLPEEYTTMDWWSACICGKDLYIAAKHNDPGYEDAVKEYIRDTHAEKENFDEVDVSNKFSDYEGYYFPGRYPCFSLYRCHVDTMLQIARESGDNDDENKVERQILWQKLQHPHHSVYMNIDQVVKLRRFLAVPEEENKADYLYYGACRFTLSSVNNELVAVGCQHIQSFSNEYLRFILKDAYYCYAVQKYARPSISIAANDNEETIDYECHIYRYDMDDDSWELVKSTPHNGDSSHQPSVAVADNKLVIVRHSQTVHIVNYP